MVEEIEDWDGGQPFNDVDARALPVLRSMVWNL